MYLLYHFQMYRAYQNQMYHLSVLTGAPVERVAKIVDFG